MRPRLVEIATGKEFPVPGKIFLSGKKGTAEVDISEMGNSYILSLIEGKVYWKKELVRGDKIYPLTENDQLRAYGKIYQFKVKEK